MSIPGMILDPEAGRMVRNDKSGRKVPRKEAARRAAEWLARRDAMTTERDESPVPF